MKKGLIILFVLLVPALLFSQDYAVDQGSMMLGGDILFTMTSGDLFENIDGDGTTTIAVNPLMLYFIMPGLAVGGSLQFTSQSQGDNKSSAMGVGPMVAYFFGGDGSKVFPYIGGGYIYSSNKTENGAEFKWTTGSIVITAGGVFMLTDAIGVGASAFYTLNSFKPEDVDAIDGNVMGVRLGVHGFIF
jgi:hypothetical protein